MPPPAVPFYCGAGLALLCEVAVVLLLVRGFHYRMFRLGCCYLLVTTVTFVAALHSGIMNELQRLISISGLQSYWLTEFLIVVTEAFALFGLARWAFLRRPDASTLGWLPALGISALANATSIVTGWLFSRSFLWLHYRAQGADLGGYWHFLFPW